MNTITLQNNLTGETVTFTSQKAAADYAGVTEMTISRLMQGVQHTVANKAFSLADSRPIEPDYTALYWKLYNSL